MGQYKDYIWACDFFTEVTEQLPVKIFMEIMGLPVDDAAQFQVWEKAMLHNVLGDEVSVATMFEVVAYFVELITQRRTACTVDVTDANGTTGAMKDDYGSGQHAM